MLHTPHYDGGVSYCGPTAMSAVTGLPISLIKQTIRDVSGYTRVTVLHPKWMLAAMSRLGWQAVEEIETENRHNRHDVFRLQDFFEAHGTDGPFIVNVTRHYIAVSHGETCDTYTKLPIEISRWKKARAGRWIEKWWRFEPAS